MRSLLHYSIPQIGKSASLYFIQVISMQRSRKSFTYQDNFHLLFPNGHCPQNKRQVSTIQVSNNYNLKTNTLCLNGRSKHYYSSNGTNFESTLLFD